MNDCHFRFSCTFHVLLMFYQSRWKNGTLKDEFTGRSHVIQADTKGIILRNN
jgi:hypothetical protein